MTTIREVVTVADALRVLPIRNEVRHFMTRHRDVITEAQQVDWWMKREWNVHLYLVERRGSAIGYGLIREIGSAMMTTELTCALTQTVRGQGYGRLLFNFMLHESWIMGRSAMLEVLDSNTNAIALYKSIGFYESEERPRRACVGHLGTIITMLYGGASSIKKPPPEALSG